MRLLPSMMRLKSTERLLVMLHTDDYLFGIDAKNHCSRIFATPSYKACANLSWPWLFGCPSQPMSFLKSNVPAGI